MKTITLLICLIGLLGPTYVSYGADYTGFWKRDCTDNFGVQIKTAGNQLYSVSFCGPGGCFEPGEWTPNTRIEGDSNYKINSHNEIGIKRKDNADFSIYKKCSNDPTWITAEPKSSELRKMPACSFETESKEKGVLIAWVTDVRETTQFGHGIKNQTTTVEPFRPVALINGTTLEETPGATIHKGQSFWRVLSPASKPVKLSSVGSLLDHMNEDHCVYFGTFGKSSPQRWTLLSSKPLPHVFRAPTPKDTKEFYRLNTTCIHQGDYPEGQEPPCVRPKLLAITDINENGNSEYWATDPYLWDTGLTVWEKNNNTLTPLLQVCVGCSD